jgi:hypothetical protein
VSFILTLELLSNDFFYLVPLEVSTTHLPQKLAMERNPVSSGNGVECHKDETLLD